MRPDISIAEKFRVYSNSTVKGFWSKSSYLVLNSIFIFVLGACDIRTGYELSFSIFYLLPISFYAIRYPGALSYLLCVISAVVWWHADLQGGHIYSHWLIPAWNALMRLMMFSFTTYLICQLKQMLEKESYLSRVDTLTGIANLRSFKEALNTELSRAKRMNHEMSLLCLDLDNFKYVNDTYGHAAGDKLIQSVSYILKKVLRQYDVPARVGGDEFLIMLPETSTDQAQKVVNKIKMSLEPVFLKYSKVSVSIGAADAKNSAYDSKALMLSADKAMYEDKRSRK